MSKTKNDPKGKTKDQPTKVEAKGSTTVVVNDAQDKIKLRNPHLTLIIKIAGLEDYERTGISLAVMKTGRAWIRARAKGLSITLPDVVIADTENGGCPYVYEGESVTPDLRVITFSKDCLTKANITPTAPQIRVKSPLTEQVIDTTTQEAAEVKEVKEVAVVGVGEAETEVVASEEDTPEGW